MEPSTVSVVDPEAMEEVGRIASVDVGKQAGGIACWKQEELP